MAGLFSPVSLSALLPFLLLLVVTSFRATTQSYYLHLSHRLSLASIWRYTGKIGAQSGRKRAPRVHKDDEEADEPQLAAERDSEEHILL